MNFALPRVGTVNLTGYQPSRGVFKQLAGSALLTIIMMTVTGCASNLFRQHYVGALKPDLDSIEPPASIGEVGLVGGSRDLAEDTIYMLEGGFKYLGQSQFNATSSRGRLHEANRVDAMLVGVEVGASKVLLYEEYSGSVHGSLPVVMPNKTTSTFSGSIFGDVATSSFSGSVTTTSWGVVNVPYSIDRYNVTAVFWGKPRSAPIMGIYVRELAAPERQDIGRNRGAVAWAIVKDSPAYRADIVRGDIIDTFDGKPVEDSRDLLSKIVDAAGKTVTIEIQRLGNVATMREGSRKVLTVKLNELPPHKSPPTSH